MPGYVIADVEVTNPEMFAEYRKLVSATVEQYGGKYLVRGGESVVVEGDWAPTRAVVIEFESFERAKEWYHSDDYAPALKMRLESANSSVIIVEGE